MAQVAESSGVGFLGLLTIVFIVLKLIGVITWSWWLVLLPTWLPTAIGLLCLGFFFLWLAWRDK